MSRNKCEVHSVILCDDVRTEISGKTILIGVYDDTIIFNSFPGTLPKICIRLSITLLEPASTFAFSVHSPEVKIEQFNRDLPFSEVGHRTSLVFEVTPFMVTRAQDFRVLFGMDGSQELVSKFSVRTPASDDERALMSRIAGAN